MTVDEFFQTDTGQLLWVAHQRSSIRPNPSWVSFKNAYDCNGGDLGKSICAALMAMGGKHAPIRATYDFLKNEFLQGKSDAELHDTYKGRYPGFGYSFNDGTLEPFWWDVLDRMLGLDTSKAFVNSLTQINIQRSYVGKKELPSINPSMVTALCCLAYDINPDVIDALILVPRISIWIAEVEHECTIKKQEGKTS